MLPRVIGMRDESGNIFGADRPPDVTRLRLLDKKTNRFDRHHELKTPNSVRMGCISPEERTLLRKQTELLLAARGFRAAVADDQ